MLPGVTGELVPVTGAGEDEVEIWAWALATFDSGGYDPAAIRRHAESFSRARFRRRMAEVVDDVLSGR